MRFLRNLLIVVVVLLIGLVAVAYLLPREVTVTRSTIIAAPPEQVFPWLNALERTAEWSPWMSLDPAIRIAYSGPPEGVGNRMTWVSDDPQVGSGAQEITLSVPNETVETSLDFGEMGKGRAWFQLAPEGAGTTLTWGLVADMGMNPAGRWMGLMMDRWVGADYERGLAALKALVEGG